MRAAATAALLSSTEPRMPNARPATRPDTLAPPSRDDRIGALRRCGILDTPGEESFDCFVRLASRLLRTPAAMATFVDDSRLFIKAAVGIADPYATERQATPGHSFCATVVERGAPFVVRDQTSDLQALYYPPGVEGGGVTYLGVPVRAPGGVAIGALAVLDSAPREFGPEEVALLEELAAGVSALVARQTSAAPAPSETKGGPQDETTAARVGDWAWQIDDDAVTMSALAAELHGGAAARETFDAHIARIHADDRPRVLRQIRQAVGGGAATYEVEYRVPGADGAPRWVHSRAGVARDAAGRTLRVAGFCHDITARREREMALQRMGAFLEGIVAHAPVAIIVATADGVVGLWNDEAERLFGWTTEECIGAPMRIVPPEWAEDYRMVRDALGRGESVSGLETHALRRDGTLLDVSLAAVRLAEQAVELGSDVYLVTV
jgi:PAS domain S-box-containing protein